jgi:hypothetical protein
VTTWKTTTVEMDYAEDQAMEVEALESILMDDMRKMDDDSGDGIAQAISACYQIEISAYGDNDSVPEDQGEGDDAVLGLVFSHTEKYPDEPPLLKCRSVRGLRDAELVDIQRKITEQAESSVGQAMIFDLVQTCKDWMRERVGASDFVDEETEEELKARLEAEAEERLKQMRLVGTPVTEENFKAWQAGFMKESGESLNPNENRADGRLTGRKWFESRSGKDIDDTGGDDDEFVPDSDDSDDDGLGSDSDPESEED